MIYTRQSLEILSNEENPEFCEILDMYKISLKESRDRGGMMMEVRVVGCFSIFSLSPQLEYQNRSQERCAQTTCV